MSFQVYLFYNTLKECYQTNFKKLFDVEEKRLRSVLLSEFIILNVCKQC